MIGKSRVVGSCKAVQMGIDARYVARRSERLLALVDRRHGGSGYASAEISSVESSHARVFQCGTVAVELLSVLVRRELRSSYCGDLFFDPILFR